MTHRSFSRFFPRGFSFTRFSSRLCAALLRAALRCTALPTAGLAESPLFCAQEADALIREAKEQIAKGDRTPLFPAMRYRILWIGYTHVTYSSLDFRMTDSDRQYLKAVTQNFEKYVETTTEKRWTSSSTCISSTRPRRSPRSTATTGCSSPGTPCRRTSSATSRPACSATTR